MGLYITIFFNINGQAQEVMKNEVRKKERKLEDEGRRKETSIYDTEEKKKQRKKID